MSNIRVLASRVPLFPLPISSLPFSVPTKKVSRRRHSFRQTRRSFVRAFPPTVSGVAVTADWLTFPPTVAGGAGVAVADVARYKNPNNKLNWLQIAPVICAQELR